MVEPEVEDVAFLTAINHYRDNQDMIHKSGIYEHTAVTACSRRTALIVAGATLFLMFLCSVVIAYAGPQNDCPCIGEKPIFLPDDDGVNRSRSITPIATNGEIFPWNNVRLPTFARPYSYHIRIHPNLTSLDVKGQVLINFTLTRDSNYIVFHSKNLTIFEKRLVNAENLDKFYKVSRMLEYSAGQQILLEFEEVLSAKENYTLIIKYTTRLSRELEGFYLSSYTTSKGERRYLATTHFEPTYARSAFPCFDEPQFKARFKMSILRNRFHIALFNMPVKESVDDGLYMGVGLMRDDFEESVEMSTYLVAFVVCDYEFQHAQTKNGVAVRVYAPPELLSQTSFALNTATKIMDHYTEFFGVPYPLPKQDLIAIPDFSAGAMENWGLITYRETSILYDQNETSAFAHQWVAVVVAHELAHQWFGNLVTMRWWNDLWLNEGFASFLEYRGVEHVMPGWSMMAQFVLDKTQQGLRLDALSTSHPISVSVHDPVEIEAIFDSISYSKGAAILYMLEKFLGLETLRSGLNDYLNTHKYGNADTKDLWSVLSKHANETVQVKAIMDTWTRQMGFPMIKISRENSSSSSNVVSFTAMQSRFLLTSEIANTIKNRAEPSPYDYKWFVPLSFYTDITSYREQEVVWMNMTDVRFEVDPKVRWLKANVNQSGFYRVNYDDGLWNELIGQLNLNHEVFSAADRASLIDDVFTLCRAGVLNVTVPLELSKYLRKERDFVPWATALAHFQNWSKFLSESSPYRLFLDYMKSLLVPVAQSVGWKDNGTHLKKLMRSDILASAILCGIEDVVKEAKNLFDEWMNKNIRVPPNLREVIYLAGIRYGDVKEWNFCWDKYNESRVPSERKLLLKVLGASNDPWLLQRYLLATLDSTKVKAQDLKMVLGVVASQGSQGQLLAWRHLKANWNNLQSLFGNGTFTMGGLITAVTSHFATEYDFKEVSEFFHNIDVGSGTRALEQSLEMIQLNVHWVKNNEAQIYDWLVKNKNNKN
ncbi:Aminopeptidase N-type,ERAP1-like C-terminal domain,Peptidase M1, membrane alanine aminopeptidase, N- [Cinara cedri]|uniref:Aminopeptidase n=1 Tax=Cinara cedri TaxID=506608 RepID=A0A5E4N519_9HEMI|nr:Aminopeptidase N-type,ERAP1-like C-terminal domain,Peptidase M1, membrane alanine aminopeptidase, N- [Cinara cedri]